MDRLHNALLWLERMGNSMSEAFKYLQDTSLLSVFLILLVCIVASVEMGNWADGGRTAVPPTIRTRAASPPPRSGCWHC